MAGFSTWLFAAGVRGTLPPGDFTPRKLAARTLTGADAAATRRALIARAAVRPPSAAEFPPLPEELTCRFLMQAPSGTTAKFDCVLDGGEVIKVKYGRSAEIHGEAAATRLLTRLGFAADRIDIVERLRCYGCPRFPFLTMQVLSLVSATRVLGEYGLGDRYSDFEWVSVERRYPAVAVETETLEGWAWFELPRESAHRGDLDALRLAAVFLAHWDNKSENQRLVCLEDVAQGANVASGFSPKDCAWPLLIIQDAGATFGPTKVNLERWRSLPIWTNRGTCEVSMRHLPWRGATFPTVQISEEGRAQLAAALSSLGDGEIRALFADARFPQFQASTDDGRDLAAWTQAFRHRIDQIVSAGPCPSRSSAPSD
jgi:hypothetical protein